MTALQADALAPLDLHAQLRAVEAIQPPDALLVDGPAFPAQHHMHAQITEAWSIHCDLSNPLPQSALIARLAIGVPDRRTQQCQAARPSHTHPEALLHPGCQLAPLGSLQSFFGRPPEGSACRASDRPR